MGTNHPPNTNPKIAKSQANFRILIESKYTLSGGWNALGSFLIPIVDSLQGANILSITNQYSDRYIEGVRLEGALTVDPAPTPLPSTWLMLLSGFVGLGFFAYRGTKKRTALAAA